ncbi:rhodanese-like domain-containing protein [Lentibacillus sp. Marseille-P4043]|uniref:rhodanese-like domain-containing protein n=1 Tax=Lentibacillus sp. Marseille-P4043 TaxID=2040293 RepID=UPI000D0BA9B7|nr:rhodanese-like domain-containing protein [Lentibacillus sp. Marseille-P4043]
MVKSVTPDELAKRLKDGENVTIIDVRENNEITTGKIPGAKQIPLGHLTIRKDELDKNKTFVVVCQSGNRSKAACGILSAFGYDVEDMIGGMNDWKGKLEKKERGHKNDG